MNLSKENVISALCLGAFGIYVISVAANLAYVSDVGPGPGFFPLWLGVGLIVFAACLIFVAPNAENRETARPAFSKTAGRALAGWVALMVAIALLPALGVSITTQVIGRMVGGSESVVDRVSQILHFSTFLAACHYIRARRTSTRT